MDTVLVPPYEKIMYSNSNSEEEINTQEYQPEYAEEITENNVIIKPKQNKPSKKTIKIKRMNPEKLQAIAQPINRRYLNLYKDHYKMLQATGRVDRIKRIIEDYNAIPIEYLQ